VGGSSAGGGSANRLPFDLATPRGRLHGVLPLPSQPVRLSEVVVPLLGLDTAVVDQTVRHTAAVGRPSRCGPACGACCRQLVPLSAPEAFALTAAMRDLPDDQRRRLRHRFAALGATLARHPDLTQRILDIEGDEAATTVTALDYFDLQLACPFLEGESCSIHPARPSICREFHVTSNPAACADPAAGGTLAIEMPLRLSELLAHAHAHLYRLDRPLLVPLALAPSWVADHPELDCLAWEPGPLLQDLLGAMARAMTDSPARAAAPLGGSTEPPTETNR